MFTFRILELTIDILLKFPTLLYFGRNFFSLHFFTDPILLNLISFPEVSPLGSALSRKGAAVLKSTILWIDHFPGKSGVLAFHSIKDHLPLAHMQTYMTNSSLGNTGPIGAGWLQS